jgi:hypothetical protein
MLVGMRDNRRLAVSPSAYDIHERAVAAAKRTEYPAFIADIDLDALAPGRVTTMAALELSLEGLWLRARDGYVLADPDLLDRAADHAPRRWLRRLWVTLNSETVIPL